MSTKEDILAYLSQLEDRLQKELPKISEEIRQYEIKLAHNSVTVSPIPSPQFNG